jgi:hypothetical protein
VAIGDGIQDQTMRFMSAMGKNVIVVGGGGGLVQGRRLRHEAHSVR